MHTEYSPPFLPPLFLHSSHLFASPSLPPQAEKTNAFDRVIETFQAASRTEDMYTLGYWLSNHVGLFYLVQVS